MDAGRTGASADWVKEAKDRGISSQRLCQETQGRPQPRRHYPNSDRIRKWSAISRPSRSTCKDQSTGIGTWAGRGRQGSRKRTTPGICAKSQARLRRLETDILTKAELKISALHEQLQQEAIENDRLKTVLGRIRELTMDFPQGDFSSFQVGLDTAKTYMWNVLQLLF